MSGPKPEPANGKVQPQRRRALRRAVGVWLRRLVLIALAVAVVAAAVVAWLPEPLGADVAEVRRGTMRITVDEDGRTRVQDRYLLSAPLSGTVARIDLQPGATVRRGDVLARIAPVARPLLDAHSRAEAEARLAAATAARRQALATVERARTAVEHTRREADRARRLAAGGALPIGSLDRAEVEHRAARADLTSAEFAVRVAAHQEEMARSALGTLSPDGAGAQDQLELTAPVDGIVLRVPNESGGVVPAGTPLIEIGDASALEIAVDVLTADAVEIRPGDAVTLERWGGDQPLRGHVRLVEPSAFTRLSALGVEEQRVNVIVDLDTPREQWTELGDGYQVEARILVWERPNVVIVPASAAFRRGEQWAAYALQDGVARLRSLRTGRRNGLEIEVLEGLRPGERVIVHPGDQITDGVEVEPR